MRKLSSILAAAVLAALLFPVTACAADADADAYSDEALLASYIGGCGYAASLPAMVGVGAVILNRCRDASFPDSIPSNGASLMIFPTPTPSPMAKYAARLATAGLDPTSGALFLFREEENAPASRVTFSDSGLAFAK